MPGKTRTCNVCHIQLLREQMAQYASNRAKNLQWYCPKCLQEKKEQDAFTDTVCSLFGIKMPGGRIWKDRKNLKETYGYTDQVIIDCLDYLYNIKHMKKSSESLCLVTPAAVHEMMEYKKQKSFEAVCLATAMQEEQKEYIIPSPKKKKQIKKVEYDPDEWLDD